MAKSPRNWASPDNVHFTPTSASWLNMLERFFRDLSEQQIRRGVFRSVPELEHAVMGCIDKHNKLQSV